MERFTYDSRFVLTVWRPTLIAHPHKLDPLLCGFYSVRDTARLLNVTDRSVRGWLNGYAGSSEGSVIDRDYKGTNTASFLDLMELRFIAHFRRQGVTMHTIRVAAQRARAEWSMSHPLALESRIYLTDRKNIIAKAARETGDTRAYNLATGQHEMWDVIEATIEKGVTFDPDSHLALMWKPRADLSEVVIDPRIAFGKPALQTSGIPTEALYRQWVAEGDKSKVANLFEISIDCVSVAIEYELAAA